MSSYVVADEGRKVPKRTVPCRQTLTLLEQEHQKSSEGAADTEELPTKDKTPTNNTTARKTEKTLTPNKKCTR